MSNEVMKREFPDNKRRNAVCFSQFRKGKKESFTPPESGDLSVKGKKILASVYSTCRQDWVDAHPDDKENKANKEKCAKISWGAVKKSGLKERLRFSKISGYELKESKSGELDTIKGYIATTHLDDGFMDDSTGKFTRDKIALTTLESWRDNINDGLPRSNKVSVHHDREPHVTGAGVRGSARIDQFDDGEYGLFVETRLDRTKNTYIDTVYQIENDFLDSFSIEFSTKDMIKDEYIEGAVDVIEEGEGIIRTLLPGTELEGWTLASQPMNSNCIMIKEIMKSIEKHGYNKKRGKEKTATTKIKEDNVNMADKEIKPDAPAESVEEPKPVEPVVEPKEEDTPAEPEKPAEDTPSDEGEKEKKDFEEFKAFKKKEKKEEELKKLTVEVKERLSKELDKTEVKEKKLINKDTTETKELTEFKEMMKSDTTLSADSQMKLCGKMAELSGFKDDMENMSVKDKNSIFKRKYDFIVKASTAKDGCQKQMLECKGLGITTNQNTDTDYLLSAAELSDVFDPMIFNMLNQKTLTWNLLPKEDFSSKGNNQVQFTGKTAANTTAAAYTGNAITTGVVKRLKFQTKFKKYFVGVEVDGDMIAAARGGPIGDVFAQEVRDSTDDLMSVMNIALFAEVGLENVAGVIGFEYITDETGNGTLYNLERSVANRLAPDTATDTLINGSDADITLGNLRKAKRQAVKEGADLNNLLFITNHVQGDKFRGIYDSAQRPVPTSSRVGFTGVPEFDGIPIFEDKDCNSDDWFLIDLETHKIAIWVPPTLEMLGKDSDSQKGFIKTYWCTYNRAPRRMVQIHTNAT